MQPQLNITDDISINKAISKQFALNNSEMIQCNNYAEYILL